MPYNTRRKSLSLPSLGIHLPNSSRRSPSLSLKAVHSVDQNNNNNNNNNSAQLLPPSKRVKRSHDSSSFSSSRSPEPHSSGISLKAQSNKPRSRRNTYEHTPPPSPTNEDVVPKIDTEGINDDVVIAVIKQLEKTGNRPHLVKELAAILVTLNENIANSANPAALLSSRLSTYLKRPWTALAPCPLAKELIPVHPRKVYYYLTTLPRQPLPDNSDDLIIPDVDDSLVTPSVSSVSSVASVDRDEEREEDDDNNNNNDDDAEDALSRGRSPSPEVDLSSPDFEDDHADVNARAGADAASRSSHGFSVSANNRNHPRRAVSPPLEGDEREFTQTASAVRERASGAARTSRLDEPEIGGNTASDDSMDDRAAMTSGGSPPMEDGSLSSTSGGHASPDDHDQYGDYFSQHMDSRGGEGQDLDEAAAVALFGTSPSPSLSSSASSVSSSSASPATEIEDDSIMNLEQQQKQPVKISDAKKPIISLPDSDTDMKMSDLATWDSKLPSSVESQPATGTSTTANMDIDLATDSWIELQSPETVEVDELDEMFGEI